jgi:hypothetical protein
MSQPKTRFTHARELLHELYDASPHTDKTLWLAHNLGLLEGIVARIAATDWILYQELEDRVAKAKLQGQGQSKR